MDGFGHMLGFDIDFTFQVCDGAADFENAVVGAGGEAEFGDGHFEEVFAFGVHPAEAADFPGAHVGIAEEVLLVPEPVKLKLAGGVHPFPNGFGGFSGGLV